MKDILNLNRKQDFRAILQEELLRRCRKNPHYSVRAFAKSLNVVPSALNEILKGTRPVSEKMKTRLGLAMGLSLETISKIPHNKQKLKTPVAGFNQITLDTYAIVSDWYHYAILELIRVKDFKSEVAWVARTLSITRSEVRIAVERLRQAGMLEITSDGKWIDTAGQFATNISGELTSAASRKLQKQILEKSICALEEVPVEKRNHTSMTMAINPEALEEAKEMITKFRRELCAFLESYPDPTHVYNLAISLYPISQNTNSGEPNELSH